MDVARLTSNKRWGLVAGERFGYEMGEEEAECMMVAEYMLNCGDGRSFHMMLYNKNGAKSQRKNSGLPRIRPATVVGALGKAVCFTTMLVVLIAINSTCQPYGKMSDSERQKLGWMSMGMVCQHRMAFIFALAFLLIGVFTCGSLYLRTRHMRQLAQASQHPKSQ